MLNLLDESLGAFLRAEVPLAPREVDLSFEAPDGAWSATITKPTVNLYLWDVRRNQAEREAGWEVADLSGVRVRQRPKPRVDCRYLVTAWTSDVRDEHALLGAVLATLLQHANLPAEHLQGAYAPVRPVPGLAMAGEGTDQSDFWSALGGQLKPGLDLTVTATVDAIPPIVTGPPVERYDVSVMVGEQKSTRRFVGGRAPKVPAGTPVVTPRGSSRVGTGETFLVPGDVGDEVVVESDPVLRGTVGHSGGVATKPQKKKP